MERKEWLETFMKLVNTGAPLLGYRRELRLFPKQVKAHLSALPQYREELRELRELEANQEKKRNELRDRLARARAEKDRRRLEAIERRAKEDAERQPDVGSESESSGDDSERADE